jgi:hypothetical protein
MSIGKVVLLYVHDGGAYRILVPCLLSPTYEPDVCRVPPLQGGTTNNIAERDSRGAILAS